jgi:hypothetical protein
MVWHGQFLLPVVAFEPNKSQSRRLAHATQNDFNRACTRWNSMGKIQNISPTGLYLFRLACMAGPKKRHFDSLDLKTLHDILLVQIDGIMLKIDIEDLAAFITDGVVMWFDMAVVSLASRSGFDRQDGSHFRHDLNCLIDRGNRKGGMGVFHLLVDVFGRGMAPAVQQGLHDRQTLAGGADSVLAQLINQHVLITLRLHKFSPAPNHLYPFNFNI